MGSGSLLTWGKDDPKVQAGMIALSLLNGVIWGVQGFGLVAFVWLVIGVPVSSYRLVKAMD